MNRPIPLDLNAFKTAVEKLASLKQPIVIGIDGESFAGKTTISRFLEKSLPSFEVLSLDRCMTDPQVRIAAFKDKTTREKLFDHWYDKNRLEEAVAKAMTSGKNLIIEGTFLLAAVPFERLDALFVMTRNANDQAARAKKLLEINPLLSPEEASALDDVYHMAWLSYKKILDLTQKAVYVALL